MHISLEQIVALLLQYKYILLFPVSAIEGPIITIIAGFFSSIGYMNIFLASLVIIAGDLFGDTIYYIVGRYGRRSFIERWGHFIGITKQRIEKMEKHFENHAGRTLILGKLAHGIGTYFLLAAGVAKVPYRKFLWFNLISTIPKTVILILIGFYFGQAYVKIGNYLDYTAIGSITLGFIFIIIYFVISKRSEKFPE